MIKREKVELTNVYLQEVSLLFSFLRNTKETWVNFVNVL